MGKGGHEPPFSLKGAISSGNRAPLMKPTNSPKPYGVRTFGCRMDVHEGECLAEMPGAKI